VAQNEGISIYPFLEGSKFGVALQVPFYMLRRGAKVDGQKAFGVVLLGLIALYFALQGRKEPPASSPQGEASPTCQARVWAATLGYQEVRLQLEGQASSSAWRGPKGASRWKPPRCAQRGSAGCPSPQG